ncbi:MAG: Txe/YoeB family addiction module toxin [Sphingobacteriales bacterium]|nr:MAG: Txe/YoeB family addiction module toxin [Sphingobacteriales bacterium]
MDEAIKTPCEGTGKPEALKHNLKGCWSKRVTDKHRLIYKVEAQSITIITCKFHYYK